jgi:hypothetical protein
MLAAILLLAALTSAQPAAAVRLLGASFGDGLLYDVDPATGAASQPRPFLVPPPCTSEPCPEGFVPLTLLAGIEVADGRLLAATHETATFHPSAIACAELAGTAEQVIGAPELALEQQIGEGDLALDPTSGDLFAIGVTGLIAPFHLLRIDLDAPSAVTVGEIGFFDVSALAFDAAGQLYAIDTDGDRLLVLDPTNAATLSSVPLSAALGPLAAMDFDPETGLLWVADGGTGGLDALATLDRATGTLTEIGPLGLDQGLSGLAVVPEPEAAALALAALAALAGSSLRRVTA